MTNYPELQAFAQETISIQTTNAMVEADIVKMKKDLVYFSILKPKLFLDGGQWCVLLGDDMQEGICGFGLTPNKAILDRNSQFDESKKTIDNG